jgi:hypothetical protein
MRLLVRPDTVMRRHRDLIAGRHAARLKPERPGRPPTVRSIRLLILRLVRENPNRGYPPKTAHSTRTIALESTTIAALRAHRSRQQAEADACGDGYCDSGYVFTNRNGTPIAVGTLTHTFQQLIAEHGVPPVRLHDLRHGAATLALAAGVELKVVQEMLGHSSIVLTADTYTSVLPEVAHTAAEKTAVYLLQAAGVVPGTTRRRRRRAPARRGGLAANHTQAALVRRRQTSERPEPARPRTRARPPRRVRPRPAALSA